MPVDIAALVLFVAFVTVWTFVGKILISHRRPAPERVEDDPIRRAA